MSLLFRSLWGNALRAGAGAGTGVLRLPTLHSRTLASTSEYPLTSRYAVSEVSRGRSPDAVMSRLQASVSAADVLSTVQAHLPTLTHKHMLQALRCLFELHKEGNINQDVIKDPTFGILCQNFNKHARAMEVHEAIEATKVLSYLSVPINSVIVQTMLQIIRCNINTLSIRQIMFLDFMLNRFDTKNHLVDALKLALPLAFQIHLPLELDRQDLPLLREMLSFSCSHDLPERCINNVVTALLLHDQKIDAQIAKSIIWSLCQVNCTEELYATRVQLLHICYDILTEQIDQLSYDDVLRTAARMKGRILEKHPEYYHEQLMDAIANYVVRNEVEFEKALLVARVMSRIAHTHLGLVEYLCQEAASNPTSLSNARTNILFGFINCLSNSNYTPDPEKWDQIRKQISANPVLNGTNTALPWAKVCLELASLGHYEEKLIAKVFSKEFLDEYLSREDNILDYLQLLTLHEAVRSFYSTEYSMPEEVLRRSAAMWPRHALSAQLAEWLSRGVGGARHVATAVRLPGGIVADLLLCLKSGHPVPLPAHDQSEPIGIEQLKLPQGAVVVCIMNFNQGCFSMNSNRLRGTFRLILDILEKQGYAALAINVNEFLSAPPHERTPYLMREVGYKCGEIGMKLSAS